MKKYILSIDQGTTSSRAILIDQEGNMIEKAQKEFPLIYPHNGWVEADPLEIWVSVVECISELFIKANIRPDQIDSIGITNQRESVVCFNVETGKPIYNAIIWQSKQSQNICDRYKKDEELIRLKTGLRINPYFSATKIKFVLENVPEAKKLYDEGKFRACTIDSWILYKLTDGKSFFTDVTNASRTLLFNIHTMKYDQELLDLFELKEEILPVVKESSDDFGISNMFGVNIPVYSLIGDQQASLFGHTCFDKGDFKTTYGTGCFMLFNTGNEIITSSNGLISTVGWTLNGKTTYALEGSVFIGGAVIQWLRDKLEVIKDAAESEQAAKKVTTNKNVYFVPAFVGLGAPYWDDDLRGSIFGLTRDANKNHIIRAALEAIAYQTRDIAEVMKKDTGLELKSIQVDGGATNNGYLMQFQADILQAEVNLSRHAETTAFGAAYMAGLKSGFFKDLEFIKNIHSIKESFYPSIDLKKSEEMYDGWKLAVKATQVFKK